MLWLRVGRLPDSAKRAILSKPTLRGVQFYYKAYSKQHMYWETVDLFRKLLVTGIVVFVKDGSSLQVTVGMLFAGASLVLQVYCKPYKNQVENWLAAAALAAIAITLSLGGLLRASFLEEKALMEHSSQVEDTEVGAIIVVLAVLIFVTAAALFIRARASPTKPTPKDAGLGATFSGEQPTTVNFDFEDTLNDVAGPSVATTVTQPAVTFPNPAFGEDAAAGSNNGDGEDQGGRRRCLLSILA